VILDDFQSGIVNALKADAYFTQSPAVPVFAEDQPQAHKDAADALVQVGIVALVGEPVVSIGDYRDKIVMQCTVALIENTDLNRGQTGTGRKARQLGLKAWALLHERILGLIEWRCASLQQVAAGDGLVVWELEVRTDFPFAVIKTLLVDQNDAGAADQTGRIAEYQPTGP
jgi:hypothetical protein